MNKLAPWLGLICGLIICCALSLFFNEDPLQVFKILTTSFFNSKFDLGLTLFYTTCLIFSGLAFAIPMKAGLFHIGSEGQIILSALIGAWLGFKFVPTDSSLINIFLLISIFLLTSASGALAAMVIAAFKYYKQSHEVVVAIMLNFIFAAATTWFTVNHIQNPESQNPESSLINASYQFLKNDPIKIYFDNSAVSLFLFFAVLICFVLHFIEKRTWLGYQINAYGNNSSATKRLGISSKKILFLCFGVAGFFSALVGLTEVLGNSFQYKVGFSPQYGFLGIAVALLARQNFIGIVGSAFLMACLHKGASDLDLETNYLTRDFSRVLQAIIIFSVAASYYFFNKKRKGT